MSTGTMVLLRPLTQEGSSVNGHSGGGHRPARGGLDAFVFTAGIGEHSAPVRGALRAKLAWLADRGFPPRTAARRSGSSPPNEELMIAQHTLALVRPQLDFGNARKRA